MDTNDDDPSSLPADRSPEKDSPPAERAQRELSANGETRGATSPKRRRSRWQLYEDLDPVAERTYRLECIRAAATGALETGPITFYLLIAIRYFQAGPLAKGLVSSGISIGLLLSPLTVYIARTYRIPVHRLSAALAAGSAVLLLSATTGVLPLYIVGCSLGVALYSAATPLITQIYQDNYPLSLRGKLYASANMVRIVVGSLCGLLFGWLFSDNLAFYSYLIAFFALCYAVSAWCIGNIPSRAPAPSDTKSFFKTFTILRDDRFFLRASAYWMLVGSAAHMLLPLRVEYLANPKYGLHLPESYIAAILNVTPNITRLLFSPFWGRLFDRISFLWFRTIIDLGFILGFLCFFSTHSLWVIVFGALCYGSATAGADIAWQLWITKFAPAERVAEYMSLHTFLTGIRSFIAPILAFQLAELLPIWAIVLVGCIMILTSLAVLLPEVKLVGDVPGERRSRLEVIGTKVRALSRRRP